MKSLTGLLFFIIFLNATSFIGGFENKNKLSSQINASDNQQKNPSIDSFKIKEAILFCKKQKLDTNIVFFVDMNIHSGKKRFFVFDLQNKKILHSGLCCHGIGMESTCSSPVFSNVKGSNCTSLGKYKTGERSYSNWGINVHYKMHGLEKTNSNAFSRIVVLHSYDPIADEEIYPE